MKKCPTCEKTFDDSMRFCQSDGTPLVDVSEAVDPYKTMVARPEDISAAIPPSAPLSGEKPIDAPSRDEDVLQLPNQSDPLKTMFASEEEIRREMNSSREDEEQVIEIPPLTDSVGGSQSPIPSAPPSPFGASEPPPSPFGSSEPNSWPEPPAGSLGGIGNMTTPPIPSPFGDSRTSEPERDAEPAPAPSFKEPEPEYRPTVNPFDQPAASSTPQWSPPPAPQAVFPERGGSGMAPPPPRVGGAAGQNQTLAIVSLVLGVISILICQLTGPVAIVLGFMARGKAKNNPSEYTGSGLALGGIITGLIGTLFLILAIFYLIFVFGFVATQNL
jgi:hypothetical protein